MMNCQKNESASKERRTNEYEKVFHPSPCIAFHHGCMFRAKPSFCTNSKPVFSEVAVHDPSIIKANGTYYVFGSHLASAKSTDLMKWTQISSSVHDGNPLIPNVYEELKEAFEWAESDTLWAPDVTQLEDGKFYMYYNACRGDSPRSALGLAVADDIEGPYKNKGIFLKSGMDGISNDGTPYDATKHPNVVDPHTFFDQKESCGWCTAPIPGEFLF